MNFRWTASLSVFAVNQYITYILAIGKSVHMTSQGNRRPDFLTYIIAILMYAVACGIRHSILSDSRPNKFSYK